MPSGQTFTVPAALHLASVFSDREGKLFNPKLKVYYDHGPESQRIYSWFGTTYTTPKSTRHLSWVDIVVAEPGSRTVHAIIEIEDSSSRPKTIIGDALAVLMGSGLAFAGHADWRIGLWTRLIVLVHAPTSKALASITGRLTYIRQHVTAIQPHLATSNAAVGMLLLDIFQNTDDLYAKLVRAVASPSSG
jgi:hypothetical protein